MGCFLEVDHMISLVAWIARSFSNLDSFLNRGGQEYGNETTKELSWAGGQRIRVEEVEVEDIGEVKTVSTGVWPIVRVLSSSILCWIGFGTLSTRVCVASELNGWLLCDNWGRK